MQSDPCSFVLSKKMQSVPIKHPKRNLAVGLIILLLGTWAFVSPDADPRVRRLAASVSPPTEGVDPHTGRRIPHAAPVAGAVLDLSIKSLGNFSFDPAHGQALPADVLRLDGVTVRLGGYMLATAAAGDRVQHFSLVPSLFACCYGQPPGVQHVVEIDCPPGHPAAFSPGIVMVQGRLHVREIRDGGYVISLFAVDADQVEPSSSNG